MTYLYQWSINIFESGIKGGEAHTGVEILVCAHVYKTLDEGLYSFIYSFIHFVDWKDFFWVSAMTLAQGILE